MTHAIILLLKVELPDLFSFSLALMHLSILHPVGLIFLFFLKITPKAVL